MQVRDARKVPKLKPLVSMVYKVAEAAQCQREGNYGEDDPMSPSADHRLGIRPQPSEARVRNRKDDKQGEYGEVRPRAAYHGLNGVKQRIAKMRAIGKEPQVGIA